MASIIRIKRSQVSGNPSTLAAGELAYSALVDNGTNGGDRLYIGIGTETNGNAANHVVIGGKYFTDLLDHTPGTLTATSALIVDSNKKINDLLVDNLQLDGNTLSTTNGNLFITPNGTGKTIITNLHIGDADTPIDEFIYDTVGGAITGGTGITITNDDAANTSTVSITNTAVVAGSYGSASEIPTFTVNAQGQLTAAGTVAIFTSLSIAGDTGTDTIALGLDTLTFAGGEGIDTSINASTNTITIAGKDASTSNKGIASFNTDNFTVTSGAVSTKNITLGTSTLTNGSTTNTLAGLQQLDVDNIRIDGNEISSTNENGNISLNTNGSGVVSVNTSRITGVLDPVDPQDAATKAYVDARAAGLDPKQSTKAATTGPITLSGVQTIDGVALAVGDRVLVKDQANNTQNGIYIVADGAWSRSSDMDEPSELTAGLFFFVESGTVNSDAGFVKSSDSVGTVGTDPITFVQFSGAGQIIAGDGLSKTGNQLDVVVAAAGGIEISADALQLKSSVAGNGLIYTNGVLDVVGTADRITVNSDNIDIASTYVGQTSITTLGTIGTGVWQGTVVGPTYGGTGVNNGTKTITLGGNFTHTGAHTLGLTTTANTSLTLPITGTLATLAGTEALSNKTITESSFAGSVAATTLSASSLVTLTDTTNATALGTAAVVLSGGLSVAKGMHIGTNITGSGAATSTLNGFNIDGGTY